MDRVDRARHRIGGFTLIELLVALAVFALMVLGLLNLSGESVRSAVVIEERALSEVVADNQIVQAALAEPGALAEPAAGVEQAGGRGWHWDRITQVDNDGLLRVVVRVRAADQEQTLAERELLRIVTP